MKFEEWVIKNFFWIILSCGILLFGTLLIYGIFFYEAPVTSICCECIKQCVGCN